MKYVKAQDSLKQLNSVKKRDLVAQFGITFYEVGFESLNNYNFTKYSNLERLDFLAKSLRKFKFKTSDTNRI